jgi:salicylate hydroxylase
METYGKWNQNLLNLIDSSEKYYKWALYDRDPLERWTVGRITLLGDSAHPMLPYLGQGACMAIEDGCILAEAIARTPNDPQLALETYEEVRKPRATRAQLGSRVRAKQNHLVSPLARFKRDIRMAWNSRFGADSSAGQAAAFYNYDVSKADLFNSD